MARSIRISDELYAMAHKSGAALERPLAQQMEYWARLGAAIDAAGITSSQVTTPLPHGKLPTLLAAANGETDNVAASSPVIRQRQQKLEAQVRQGKRSADSLRLFTSYDVANATLSCPPSDEPSENDGW